MGLDTVTLVVDVEKYFNISISNREAEKIFTVQDLADCVFGKVTLHPGQKCRSQNLFYRFRWFFVSHKNMREEYITLDTRINELISSDDLRETWIQMETFLNVKLPELSQLDVDPSIGKEIKFLGLKFWTRKTPVTNGTVSDLINWTLSLNHRTLLDPKCLHDKTDVERIIAGILNESFGIPVDEIKLQHSITNDLALD